MLTVILRIRRASVEVPSVWRTPAMPHIELVLSDRYRFEGRLQARLGLNRLTARRCVDGALLLGHEPQGRSQPCQDRDVDVKREVVEKCEKQKNGECGTEGA